jgi:hypothetical protein
VGAQVRDPETGQAARDVPDGRHAVRVKREDFDHRDAEDHRRQSSRDDRHESPEPEDKREGGYTDQHRQAVRVIELRDQLPQFPEEVTRARRHAQEGEQLPDNDRERKSSNKALQYRFGNEVRDETEPQQPCRN